MSRNPEQPIQDSPIGQPPEISNTQVENIRARMEEQKQNLGESEERSVGFKKKLIEALEKQQERFKRKDLGDRDRNGY